MKRLEKLKYRLVELAASRGLLELETEDFTDYVRWQPYIHARYDFHYKRSWYDDFGIERSLSDYREPVFGFEIEFETNKADEYEQDWRLARKMSRIVSRNRYLSCHYDSAIKGAGFEVRSEPATLGFFMNRFDWSYLRKLERLDARTVGVGERGFHIHVDKRAFVDDAHIERFALHVSGDVSAWAQGIGFAHASAYAKLIDASDPWWKENKYLVVNVSNPATVEVRCLVPTFDETRIREYFFYVKTVIEMTKGGE